MANKKSKYPHVVKFLQQALEKEVGEDSANLAIELSSLLVDLEVSKSLNEGLEAENEILRELVENSNGIVDEVGQYPQFPRDFYNSNESAKPMPDEDIQEMVESVIDTELTSNGFAEIVCGDTYVIKTNLGGEEKIVVARGFYELSLDVEDEDFCCGDPYPYCSDCPDN